jgi:FMN phosphatase YigB (HAD superfamily)
MIQAVFFDLDNTLLENDGDRFLEDFLDALAGHLAALVPPERFKEAAMVAGAALMADHPEATNHEAMLSTLASELNLPVPTLEAAVAAIAGEELARLGGPSRALPEAREAVLAVRARGLKTVIATSPIYPEGPIRERMRRAKVDDLPWDLITTWDNMHSVKPRASYFQEAAALLGVPPAHCLMVGDDAFQDLPARRAGFATYYVGVVQKGQEVGPAGPLAELVTLLDGLSA